MIVVESKLRLRFTLLRFDLGSFSFTSFGVGGTFAVIGLLDLVIWLGHWVSVGKSVLSVRIL
jgi:hypothetical protein